MTADRIPDLSLNFYSKAAIRDPRPVYREMLEAGPVVRLRRHKVLAVSRHADLRRVLKDQEAFPSSGGVTLSPLLNSQSKTAETVLVSDGEAHMRLRKALIAPMRPRALEEIRDRIEKLAVARVDALIGRGRFEGMEQLASLLPVSVVAELVGLEGAARERMLKWSKATFNMIGAVNLHSLLSLPTVFDMLRFQRGFRPEHAAPGSWVRRLFDLRDTGELTHHQALGMVIDYIAPSLDTTIFASGNMLERFARHPDQWEKLRANSELVPGAVNEALRIDPVIRAFSRLAAREAVVDGVTIREGERLLVVFGAANADPRRYEDPDQFDITRDARDHMAFGHGVHACAGAGLARLEMEVLLRALLERVARIEVGKPTSAMNNTLFGFKKLPLELVSA